MRTAGAVRRGALVTLDRDLDVLVPVVEMVDGIAAVTAGDERGGSTELAQTLGQLASRALAPCQGLRPR